MKNSLVTLEQVARNYAFMLAAALIGYFLIMRALGLAENLSLRLFNFVILAIGVFLAVRRFRDRAGIQFTYVRGLLAGTFTAVLGSAVFGFFLWIYLNFMDPGFMEAIKVNAPFGPHLNPYIIAAVAWIEGIFSGMVFSFISMMLLTDDRELI